jgi:triacylglycerol lipase
MQKPAPVYLANLVLHPEDDAAYVHFENAATQPFEPDPSTLTRVNAWWLAESALLSYWNEADATRIFGAAGLQSKALSRGSTECYIAWDTDFVIVAFRGTEPNEWEDVLTDGKVRLVPWHAGKVHRGFKEALEDIWTPLEAELKIVAPGRTVWFCGHSLGAALATLAADRYPHTKGVCTFGCPRVGDHTFGAAFHATLKDRTVRYVNHHDVVTHVPPPLFGYEHVELRRFIAPDGTISGAPPSLLHFFADLLGSTESLLDIINGMNAGTIRTAPQFLLEHMPKAYAIWTWNDYDANG